MHRCKHCNMRFDKSSTYFTHRRKEHKGFICPDCGKVFGIQKKLYYHLRGCRQKRRNKIRQESGSVISISNYKRLPIVTAKDLDVEFEIYMDRKFGKKGTFRNKKMCKFCCKTFVMASDFADHIRGHYKSIPLDATSVKSKFDFMQFMGLKIRETNDTDCSDTDSVNKLENKMAECRVVIIGERCKICHTSFKCRTDLDQHNKIHHSPNNRNKIMLVLKIGKEIISKIPLKKRHIRRIVETGCQPNCKGSRIGLDEMYNTSRNTSDVEGKRKDTEAVLGPVRRSTLNYKSNYVSQDLEVIEEQRRKAQPLMSSEKERKRMLQLQNEINQTEGNMKRCSREARVRKETVAQEELDTVDTARTDFDLDVSGYATRVGDFEFGSRRIYADEFFDSMQFSEPWKDEFADCHGSWYSEAKLEENDPASDGEDSCCYIETIRARLTPKDRNAWEEEHYNDTLNNEDSGSYHDISFHESPPIYKYSCDSKYQAAFSFPSDEKSFELRVEQEDNEETNNNEKETNHNARESCVLDYRSGGTVKDERTNLTLNHSRSATYQCQDKSCGFQDLKTGKASINMKHEYQEVLIKEEVMLDDCTCCINEDYPSLSHFNT